MLGVAFGFFIALSLAAPKFKQEPDSADVKTIVKELLTWDRLVKIIWAPLAFTALFCIYDSFFFTVGPLLAESYRDIQPFNGLIISAYSIPTLLTVMYAAKIANRFGKKKIAYLGLLLAAIPLCLFPLTNSPLLLTALIFISAIASSFCIPALSGLFTDYICEAREYEEDIEGISDFMTNVGYFIGPILAGLVADSIGYLNSFAILGVVIIIGVTLLLKFTPKNINIRRMYSSAH